jgi:hypothetical protein
MTRRQGLAGGLTSLLGLHTQHARANAVSRDPVEGSILASVPERFRGELSASARPEGYHGVYFSRYFDYCRLLDLRSDGTYALILWNVEEGASQSWQQARAYRGRYEARTTPSGDTLLILDIASQDLANGGDANDEALIFMRSGESRYLLRLDDFDAMAFDIRVNGRLGRSENYLFDVQLDDPLPAEPYEGRDAPPIEDLPGELRDKVNAQPIETRIIHVDMIGEPAEFVENRQVLCTLDKGSDDGLYMNMPLYSPEGSGRELEGWVWQMDRKNCRAGIRYTVGPGGDIIDQPRIGDVLTSAVAETPETL